MSPRIFDVFNGDADGICALHQLRLAEPVNSELITGPKRDISLLKRVQARAGDRITVLDIALSKNRDALDATFPPIHFLTRISIPMPMSAPACW